MRAERSAKTYLITGVNFQGGKVPVAADEILIEVYVPSTATGIAISIR